MRIDDFIWLPNIVEKLDVKHQVSQDEADKLPQAATSSFFSFSNPQTPL